MLFFDLLYKKLIFQKIHKKDKIKSNILFLLFVLFFTQSIETFQIETLTITTDEECKNRNEFKNEASHDIINGGVEEIGYEAFSKWTSTFSAEIGGTVSYIGEYAFADCSDLDTIKNKDNVRTIGQYVFRLCKSLNIVTFGNNVNTIEESAFSSCTSLPSITKSFIFSKSPILY